MSEPRTVTQMFSPHGHQLDGTRDGSRRQSFVVSQAIGLDAGNAAADYIHLYHGDATLLAESLEIIRRTSSLILSAIETAEVAQVPTEEKPAGHPTTQDATDAALAEIA